MSFFTAGMAASSDRLSKAGYCITLPRSSCRAVLLAVCASATRRHITNSMPEASVNIQALCKKKQAVESQENLMAEWDGQILKEKQDIANQLQYMGEIFGGLQWYLSRNRTTSRKFCIDFRRLNAVAIKVRYPLLDFVNRLRRGEVFSTGL